MPSLLVAQQNANLQMLRRVPGLVLTSSTYPDLQNGGRYTQTGFGFIVKDQDRFFVVTAAHLTQGPVDIIDTHRRQRGIDANNTDYTQIRGWDGKTEQVTNLDWTHAVANNMQDLEIFLLKERPDAYFGELCLRQVGDKKQWLVCASPQVHEMARQAENLRASTD